MFERTRSAIPIHPFRRVFLAFPFRPQALEIVESVLRPEIESRGMACVTLRNEPSASLIDSILATVSTCDGVIGLLTESNPNVLFELGVACGVGLPAILISDDPSFAAMLKDSHPVVPITSGPLAIDRLVTAMELAALRHSQSSNVKAVSRR